MNHPVCLLNQVFIQTLQFPYYDYSQRSRMFVDFTHARSGPSPAATSNEAHHKFLKPKIYQNYFKQVRVFLPVSQKGEPTGLVAWLNRHFVAQALRNPGDRQWRIVLRTRTGARQHDIRLACVSGSPANFPQSPTRHTASVRRTGNTTYGERALPLSRKFSIDDT